MLRIIFLSIFLSILSFIATSIVRRQERKKSLLSVLSFNNDELLVKNTGNKLSLLKKIEKKASKGGIQVSGQEVITFFFIGMVAIFGFSYILFGNLLISLLLMPIGALLPNYILKNRIRKRAFAISDELIELLKNMANSLRAGATTQQAFDAAAIKVSGPFKTVTNDISKDIAIGEPIISAFSKAIDKVPLKAFEDVVLAIRLNSELGGDLAEALESIATDIEQLKKTREILQAQTASGRWSSMVVSGMPFFLVAVLRLISPDYMKPMFESTTGYIIFAVALFLVFVGLFWSKKITTFDFITED